MPVRKTILTKTVLASAFLFAAGTLTGCAIPMAQTVANMLKSDDGEPAKKAKKRKKPAALMVDE